MLEYATAPPLFAVREAGRDDVAAIARMLADDDMDAVHSGTTTVHSGTTAVHPGATAVDRCLDAFDTLAADPRALLLVGERAGRLIAICRVTFLTGPSTRGARPDGGQARVEAVCVHAAERGHGVGTALIDWVSDEARRRGCRGVRVPTGGPSGISERFGAALGSTAPSADPVN